MYSIDWAKIFGRRPSNSVRLVSGTVWALGFTSFLTDVSSEMVTSVLPVYLITFLGLGPIAFGWVDGVQQGAAALVRLAGGFFADRWRRHKEVAVFGYGLSAACRLLLLFVGGVWTSILAVIALDRIGKGIRTAPRDALISQNSHTSALATAFGVHRSLDGLGAMLGPLLAFTILFILPGAFNVLFVVSFGIALIGLAVIMTFVRGAAEATAAGSPFSFRTALELRDNRAFRTQVLVGAILGLATISDSFVFLILQRKLNMSVTAFPLLFVGTFLFSALFAVPCGRLADRFGRAAVLICGYLVLIGLYVLLLAVPSTGPMLIVIAAVGLLGIYYAATDGVLTAMAAAALPQGHFGTGLALLATSVNVARLAAAVLFGYAWNYLGLSQATFIFLIALVAAVGCSALLLARPRVNWSSNEN